MKYQNLERRLSQSQYEALVEALVEVLEQTKQLDTRQFSETTRMIRGAILSKDSSTIVNVTNGVHPDPGTENLHFDIQIIKNSRPLPMIHVYVQPELFFENGVEGLIYHEDTTVELNESQPYWQWVYVDATQ